MRIKKYVIKTLALITLLGLLLGLFGCQSSKDVKPLKWISYEFFDTFTVLYDYSGEGEESFEERRAEAESVLSLYHKLFDVYNSHEGITGVFEINKKAGQGAVKVCPELIEFLEYCKELYELTDGAVNIAMGAVLSIWHRYREEKKAIPTEAELSLAAEHCNIDDLVIDKAALTVELKDPYMSLDLGAIGKGYAVEKASQALIGIGAEGCVIDSGGNLRAIGTKPDGSGWSTGITNPKKPTADSYSYKLELKDSALATSGDYQRYYTVDGVRYHHIIDGETLMPAGRFSSVSVLSDSAALSDGLSTAFFIMSYEDGLQLATELGVDVLWITTDGKMLKTEGMS